MQKITFKSSQIWVLFVLVALLAALPVSTVSAALRTCRTDPIVFLSNGSKVSLSATMATDAANVREIKYTLHVPQGVMVTNVVFTGGDFARKEMIMVWFDQPQGVYTTETVVHANQGIVDVSATTMLMVGIVKTAYGHSGDRLLVELSDPGTDSREGMRPRGR